VSPFRLWSLEHFAILFLTFALPVVLGWWARRDSQRRRARWIAVMIAIVLMVQLVLNLLLFGSEAKLRWEDFLPLHLCHMALFACVDACLTRRQLSYELAYFWGLGGTLQGLITPGLNMGFPSVECALFFVGHSGIVACVIFLTLAFRLRPTWRSVWRAFAAILAYALVIGAFNIVFGTNYGFLCAKPETATLFDYLGDWPWYIASLIGISLISFILLYLPWAVADLQKTRKGSVI
jgi:hypothetical integral membrane protein (TIGR02206 family)